MKLNQYQITLSRYFPSHHPRKGQPTHFINLVYDLFKLHTIRENYAHWQKIIEDVNAGRGVLNVKQWTGKPYFSHPKTIFTITGGLGYQKIDIRFKKVKKAKTAFIYIDGLPLVGSLETTIMENDGLKPVDFCNWFKKDLIGGIIIHFTSLRYQ